MRGGVLLLAGCSNAVAPADDTWWPPVDTDSCEHNDSGDRVDSADTGAGHAPIVLNEVLADNKDGLANELGDPADWVELYNAGDDAIDLTGWSLSDASEKPWVFTASPTLKPGQFLLIWCDEVDDKNATALHADFRLSRSGEPLTLRDASGAEIDAVTYPMLDTDQSWGRIPDGAESWSYTAEPTPGANNR